MPLFLSFFDFSLFNMPKKKAEPIAALRRLQSDRFRRKRIFPVLNRFRMTMKEGTIMKKTLATIATVALLGSTAFAPIAIAQGTTQPAPAAPGAAAPATPGATTMAPATPSASSGTYLTEQGATQISANDYIGNAVYTSTDESIGSVTNLILEENGGIVAAVVGVGGFLGIGAKDVAVPLDKLTVTRDTQNGTVRLTTSETSESLKAAPEFVTTKEKKAAAPAATDGATTAPKP
jgi:sporulation protein YlmC with PRC-barrel domain